MVGEYKESMKLIDSLLMLGLRSLPIGEEKALRIAFHTYREIARRYGFREEDIEMYIKRYKEEIWDKRKQI